MIALIIAQNGLGTATAILSAKAVKLRKLADKGGPDAMKLAKQAKKVENLATALKIANEGISEYQAETSA